MNKKLLKIISLVFFFILFAKGNLAFAFFGELLGCGNEWCIAEGEEITTATNEGQAYSNKILLTAAEIKTKAQNSCVAPAASGLGYQDPNGCNVAQGVCRLAYESYIKTHCELANDSGDYRCLQSQIDACEAEPFAAIITEKCQAATLKLNVCGNKVLEFGETCDDGNTNDADTCGNDCQWNAQPGGWPISCGDGHVTAPEACDDGNKVDGDGCSQYCQTEFIFIPFTAKNDQGGNPGNPPPPPTGDQGSDTGSDSDLGKDTKDNGDGDGHDSEATSGLGSLNAQGSGWGCQLTTMAGSAASASGLWILALIIPAMVQGLRRKK